MARRPHKIEIDLDPEELAEQIERAASQGAEALRSGGKELARALKNSAVTDDGDDDGRENSRSRRSRRRRREEQQRTADLASAAPIIVPPETPSERRDRLVSAVFDSGALWVFAGMLIASFTVGIGSGPGVGLLVGGGVMYVAMIADAFHQADLKRTRRLRKAIREGALPNYIPEDAPVTHSAPMPDSIEGRIAALIARIRMSQQGQAHPLIQPAELDRIAEVAAEYQAKAREVGQYLDSIGGFDRAQSDLAALRTQLETMRDEDHRRASVENLLQIKEQTARNLKALAEFQRHVEAKLAEQLAHLESLDAALLRHKLGSFERKQQTEATIWTEDLASLSQGLTHTAEQMEEELRQVDRQLL